MFINVDSYILYLYRIIENHKIKMLENIYKITAFFDDTRKTFDILESSKVDSY